MPELSPELQQFIKENLVDRHNTNSLKWDLLQERYGNPNLLPLWVADMEFKTPAPVREALTKRVQEGVFGYAFTPDSYYQAFFDWQKRRHNIELKKDWVRFDTGVVNSIYAIVNWLTEPGDSIAVMQPVYYPFTEAIEDNKRQVVSIDLLNTANGWQIDFERLEDTFKKQTIKLMIFCSPHNPVGRIWREDELRQVLSLCHKYQVQIISDEIHEDFEVGSQKFVSVLNVDNGAYRDDVIVLNAPSKTFNLAGLLNSHVIIPNSDKRAAYDDFIKTIHQTSQSILGQVAGEAGYAHGKTWFDQLLGVIRYNYQYLKDSLHQVVPEIQVADLQGTYLCYVNLAPIVKPAEIKNFVQDACGLAVDYGAWFSPKDQTFIRLNLATDPDNVAVATKRLVEQLSVKAH